MEKQIIFEGNLEQFCVGCSNYDNCIRTNFDLIQCNYAEENYKEIEIPTTWEEFKDFCKDIKYCEVKDNCIKFFFHRQDIGYFKLLEFCKEGKLYISDSLFDIQDLIRIGSNLSVKQMYQFLILFKSIRDKEYDIDKK